MRLGYLVDVFGSLCRSPEVLMVGIRSPGFASVHHVGLHVVRGAPLSPLKQRMSTDLSKVKTNKELHTIDIPDDIGRHLKS